MEWLKIASVAFGLMGTLVLAVRVTQILRAISMAVQFHDLNFQITAERASGNTSIPNIQMYGSAQHIKNAEKFGTKLLVAGFALQIAGGICQVLSLVISI